VINFLSIVAVYRFICDHILKMIHDAEKLAAAAESADAMKLLALGHKEELKRNFSVYSIAAMGFVNGK
jgi:hypothetical protein